MKQVMQLWMDWSTKTFSEATAKSSLSKLMGEVLEVHVELDGSNKKKLAEEYVDCIMCLLHSAAKAGLNMYDIDKAFYDKYYANTHRTWQLNSDNTYSHKK